MISQHRVNFLRFVLRGIHSCCQEKTNHSVPLTQKEHHFLSVSVKQCLRSKHPYY